MKKHKRYHNQIKDDKQKEYDEMESSQADMRHFRRDFEEQIELSVEQIEQELMECLEK